MIQKMKQDLGNELETKSEKLQETLSKEIQDLRIKQAEMQNKRFIRSNQKQNIEGRRISEVEDRLVEITDVEKNIQLEYSLCNPL